MRRALTALGIIAAITLLVVVAGKALPLAAVLLSWEVGCM